MSQEAVFAILTAFIFIVFMAMTAWENHPRSRSYQNKLRRAKEEEEYQAWKQGRGL